MPHIRVEYSANVESWVDLSDFCDILRNAVIETEVFPMPGTRVRAARCDHYSIADGGPEHGFIDIVMRIREGRPFEARRKATDRIFSRIHEYLKPCMEQHSLSLSFEMLNINDALSPKVSSTRTFLAKRQNA